MRLFDVVCSRRVCGVALHPREAWRRYEGSAWRDGDPYCAACASAINRHDRKRTLVIAPWYSGLIVRRYADGAHAEVLAWNGERTAVVRFGVAGSIVYSRDMLHRQHQLGDRVVAEVDRTEFEIVRGTDVLAHALS